VLVPGEYVVEVCKLKFRPTTTFETPAFKLGEFPVMIFKSFRITKGCAKTGFGR